MKNMKKILGKFFWKWVSGNDPYTPMKKVENFWENYHSQQRGLYRYSHSQVIRRGAYRRGVSGRGCVGRVKVGGYGGSRR